MRTRILTVAMCVCSLLSVVSCGQTTQIPNLEAFLEEAFQATLDLHPAQKTQLGMDADLDRWDDLSERGAKEEIRLYRNLLERLRNEFDITQMDARSCLSWRLYEKQLLDGIEALETWGNHAYPVSQMDGWHSRAPYILMQVHTISDLHSAEAYIQRLSGLRPLLDQLRVRLKRSQEKGILLPRFTFDYVIRDCQNVITGRPFDQSETNSPLFEDFCNKIDQLNVSSEKRSNLTNDARQALQSAVGPAYRDLITLLQAQKEKADNRAGVWKLPQGEAYYRYTLRNHTTTDMSQDQMFAFGLSEIERIHQAMRAVMKQVGFAGSLQDFFEYTRTDPKFYYPNTDQGRVAYLRDTERMIEAVNGKVDVLFNIKPEALVIVRPVEAFREASTGNAFYEAPDLKGQRPGVYYVNLSRMSEMPKYFMEVVAYHEAVPGHHMQIAIQQELTHLPQFRRHSDYTAYAEGWGLYAEKLAKDLGFYSDPYSEFGRLAADLQRSARLVVDIGLHAKKWSRDEAIDYLIENTPNQRSDVVQAVDRYCVWPGHATAYKVGLMRIHALRSRAETTLKQDFDVRGFHDVLLREGALPMTFLDEIVTQWLGEAGHVEH